MVIATPQPTLAVIGTTINLNPNSLKVIDVLVDPILKSESFGLKTLLILLNYSFSNSFKFFIKNLERRLMLFLELLKQLTSSNWLFLICSQF